MLSTEDETLLSLFTASTLTAYVYKNHRVKERLRDMRGRERVGGREGESTHLRQGSSAGWLPLEPASA